MVPGDPIVLPLDAYQLSFDELVTIAMAEARLVKSCAARFGVVYNPSREEVLQGTAGLDPDFDYRKQRHFRLYGIYDETAAREHGFMLPDNPLLGERVPPTERTEYEQVVLAGLEEGELYPQLRGDEVATPAAPEFPDTPRPMGRDGEPLPQGGCQGEATRILAGEGELFHPFYTSNIQGEAYFPAQEDRRVQEVTRKWSECMKQRGYDVHDPVGLGDPAWDALPAEQRPGPGEAEMALADVACKKEVNYVGVRVAVESAYQVQVIEKYHEELERNRGNARRMLDNANKVA